MNIYKPEPCPEAPPIIWGERYYLVPPPETLWRDGEIRRGMEYALRADDVSVAEITKQLVSHELEPLLSVEVRYPYQMPPSVYKPGCMTNNQEEENTILREFAFDAYDCLAAHFSTDKWCNWFVAPYFAHGDDTRSSVNIGVFVAETFNWEVVE